MFLDFDGTLAPIVDDPASARISSNTRRTIERLRLLSDGAVAMLTGRELADLDNLLGASSMPAAGSHGLEMRGIVSVDTTGACQDARLAEPARVLGEYGRENELLVEFKPGAVAVHYRARPALGAACREMVERVASSNEALRFMHGNMVSEVALAGIDKGTALRQFMTHLPFAGRLPVMAGDDVTDEDAMAAAQDLGGFGIKIGAAASVARYRLADTETFLSWLDKVSAEQVD